MKSRIFNSLLMVVAVTAAYLAMRGLPDQRLMPPSTVSLHVRSVELSSATNPLRLAGAWALEADDPRFGGLSGLTIDRGRFLAVSDRGAAMRFDFPTSPKPQVQLRDLREGPSPFGKKWARDAESLARDPQGRGWWVGYEQNHSLWLYDHGFGRALTTINLNRPDWWNNRGAEGLVVDGQGLLVFAENGRDAMPVDGNRVDRKRLIAGADVAEAATAPDGSQWLLLRSRNSRGISQSIARLVRTKAGYRIGPAWQLPKSLFDNYEGMAIEALPSGSWRFWLVTDDGHRIMARTLLVALDHVPSKRDKSPARRTGLWKELRD